MKVHPYAYFKMPGASVSRERVVEAHLVKEVEAYAGIAYKFTSPGRRSVPDRLIALPCSNLFFVEMKEYGELPDKGQVREHERLWGMGHEVYVVDSKEGVNGLLLAWRMGWIG